MMTGSFVMRLAAVLAACLSGLGPIASAAAAGRLDAAPVLERWAAADPCADARAHFDIAREIGTREALKLHADLFPDCPFAPLARMLMEKMPAAAAPAAAADKAGEPPAAVPAPAVAAADATRYAKALTDRLTEWNVFPGQHITFAFEDAAFAGDMLTITGLQALDEEHPGTGIVQSRWRFDKTVVSRPVLGDDGSLSADRIEFVDGKTEDRSEASHGWVDALSGDKGQALSSKLVVSKPAFVAGDATGAKAADALGGRLRFESADLDAFRVTLSGKDVLTLSGLHAVATDVSDRLPGKVNLSVADASMDATLLAQETRSGIPPAMIDALGYKTLAFRFDTALVADRAARTLRLNTFELELKDGAKLSLDLGVAGLDAVDLASRFLQGQPEPDDIGASALTGASLSLQDEGLTAKLLAVAAQKQGMSADVLKGVAAFQLQAGVLALTNDPALSAQAFQAALTFLNAPGTILVTLAPEPPLTLAEMVAGNVAPEAMLGVARRSAPSVTVNAMAPIRLFAPSASPAAAVPLVASPAFQACSRLAADSDDPAKPADVAGIKDPADIDSAAAIEACEAAHLAAPADPQTAFHLGRSYLAAGRLEDAARLFKEAADEGHVMATYEYAAALHTGSGVAQDTGAAAELFRGIADKVPYARDQLASMLYSGDGVAADIPGAIALWTAGAEANEPGSLYNLGVESMVGTAVPVDLAKGEDYLKRASDQGNAEAMAELGKLYFRATDGEPDYAKAFGYLLKAADGGSAVGLSNAGMMLAVGLGTDKDIEKGADFLLTALARKEGDAAAYLIEEKASRFDRDFRRAVQRRLKAAGVYKGAANGHFGISTIKALEAYDEVSPSPHAEIAPTAGGLPDGWQYDLAAGHSKPIKAVAFSADGTLVATGSADHTIRLWDAHSGALTRTLYGHDDVVSALAFDPKASVLASGSADGTVRLWDMASGRQTLSLPSEDGAVSAVAFSPDGLLVAGGSAQDIEFWNAGSGAVQGRIVAHESIVNALGFSPDGKSIASASLDQTAAIWDVATGTLVRRFSGGGADVSAVTFAAGGKVLATASGKTISLWNAKDGTEIHRLDGHVYETIYQLAASPDGKTIASAGGVDSTIKLWDADSGALLRSLDSTGYVNSVAFGPDGKTLVSGSDYTAATVWDLAGGVILRTLTSSADRSAFVGFGPAGTLAIASASDGSVRLWNQATGEVTRSLAGHGFLSAFAASPDGAALAAASYASIDLWSAADGATIGQIPNPGNTASSLAFSPDRKSLAVGSGTGDVAVWKADGSGLVRTLKGHQRKVGVIAFSPDGRLIATGSDDKSIKLWDGASGELRQTLALEFSAGALAFSPDGTMLASGSYGPLVIWDTRSGARLRTIDGVTSIVKSLRFTPDGKTIAVVQFGDRTVKLFDAEGGQLLHELAGHEDLVNGIDISADGKTLASTSDDHTVRLWDMTSSAEIATFVAYPHSDVASVLAGKLWTSSKAAERFVFVRRPDGLELPLTQNHM